MTFEPGRSSLKKRLEVFFDRDPTDIQKDRPRQIERVGFARAEQRMIDAARPDARRVETALR